MNEIIDEIESVYWQSLETAYGKAIKIPGLLKSLALEEEKIKLSVSHDLWCSLCHQHAYVSSAAEPAFSILLKIFPLVSEIVQIEIMDIFTGFAVCTAPDQSKFGESFQVRLYSKLIGEIDFFENLCNHSNEQIASFAESIIEFLQEE